MLHCHHPVQKHKQRSPPSLTLPQLPLSSACPLTALSKSPGPCYLYHTEENELALKCLLKNFASAAVGLWLSQQRGALSGDTALAFIVVMGTGVVFDSGKEKSKPASACSSCSLLTPEASPSWWFSHMGRERERERAGAGHCCSHLSYFLLWLCFSCVIFLVGYEQKVC